MSGSAPTFPLFSRIGIELEYVIVDEESLSVLPLSDALMRKVAGACTSDVDRGALAWSNELVLHVIELKTKAPAISLDGLSQQFQSEVCQVNRHLRSLGARLMPTGMHPWMDPRRETRLWPYEYSPIYRTFDRIFDCRRHGWANLQSMHLNLPFANDEEFARLHAAVRLVLPLLPALTASSPIRDGRTTGSLDNRLEAYRTNCAEVPSITGRVIPEPVFSRRKYEKNILRRMYRDISLLDPEGLLQDEFLNARGAIARFSRHSIEIRVIDMQECPEADLAIAAATVAVLKALVDERWSDVESHKTMSTESLEKILLETITQAGAALIAEPAYLRLFGLQPVACLSVNKLWRHVLAHASLPGAPERTRWEKVLQLILDHGCLAQRILRARAGILGPEHLREIYGQLCDCLESGDIFVP